MNQPVRSWIHDPQWWQRTPFQDRLAQWRVYLHPTWAPLDIYVTLVYNRCNYLSLKLLILLLTKHSVFFFGGGGASFNRHWTWNTNQENMVLPALWRVIWYFGKLVTNGKPHSRNLDHQSPIRTILLCSHAEDNSIPNVEAFSTSLCTL